MIMNVAWLCARFTLSFRNVEEMLAERGVDVSNEAVRRWFLKFGRLIACNLRRSRPQPSPRWHLGEMVIKIRGRKHWLWRAVRDETGTLYLGGDWCLEARVEAAWTSGIAIAQDMLEGI